MMLKDLIDKHKWLLEVPTDLLECMTFEESWLEQNKEDYIFVDGEHLVGAFLEVVKEPKTIKYNKHSVMFGHNNKILTIDDGYNDITERISVRNKLKIFGILTYYYTENPTTHVEDVKSFKVSKSEYEKMKIFVDKLQIL